MRCSHEKGGGRLNLKRGDIVVPVPFHKKVPKGTIRAIIREAEVTVKEFLEKDP